MKIAAAVVAGVCAALCFAVQAQTFPSKPIRWIMPFPPGGPADSAGRVIAPKFSERMGQPVIIETRAGASGNLGAEVVLKSAPDGYTLFYAISGMVTNPAFVIGSPDPRDFTAIGLFMTSPWVILTSNAFTSTTLGDVLAAIKAKPGSVSCGSSGALPTVGCELLRYHAKADMIMVLYKGNGPAMNALMGGEVNILFDAVATAVNQVKGGKVRAVATLNPKRGGMGFPELPIAAETIPNFIFEGWHGVLGPGGMPRDIVLRMNREFNAVMASPEVQKIFIPQAFQIVSGPPELFSDRIRNEMAMFGKIASDTGIKPQ